MTDDVPEWKLDTGLRPPPAFQRQVPGKTPQSLPNRRPLTKREEAILAALSVDTPKNATDLAKDAGFKHRTGLYHHLQKLVLCGLVREEACNFEGVPTKGNGRFQYYLAAPAVHAKKFDGNGKVVAEEFQNWPEGDP